jgi:hypothetical protein
VTKPLPIAVRASMQKEAAPPLLAILPLLTKLYFMKVNAQFAWNLGKSGLTHSRAAFNAKKEDGSHDWKQTAKHVGMGAGLGLSSYLSARMGIKGAAALPASIRAKSFGNAMNKFTKTLNPVDKAKVLELNKGLGTRWAPWRATRAALDPAPDVLKAKSELMRGFAGYDKAVGGAEKAWQASTGSTGIAQRVSNVVDRFAPEQLLYRKLAGTGPEGAAAAAAKRQALGARANTADFWAGFFMEPMLTNAYADSRYAGLGTPEYTQIQQQRQQALAEAQAAAQGQQAPQQQSAQTRPPTSHHRQHPSQRAGEQQQPRLTPQQQHLQQLESDWQQRQKQYRQNTRFGQ